MADRETYLKILDFLPQILLRVRSGKAMTIDFFRYVLENEHKPMGTIESVASREHLSNMRLKFPYFQMFEQWKEDQTPFARRYLMGIYYEDEAKRRWLDDMFRVFQCPFPTRDSPKLPRHSRMLRSRSAIFELEPYGSFLFDALDHALNATPKGDEPDLFDIAVSMYSAMPEPAPLVAIMTGLIPVHDQRRVHTRTREGFENALEKAAEAKRNPSDEESVSEVVQYINKTYNLSAVQLAYISCLMIKASSVVLGTGQHGRFGAALFDACQWAQRAGDEEVMRIAGHQFNIYLQAAKSNKRRRLD